MKYLVTITLTDGNEVQARVVADNEKKAIKKVQKLPEYLAFAGNNAVSGITAVPDANTTEYTFKLSTYDPEDPNNLRVSVNELDDTYIDFRRHHFNDTSRPHLGEEAKKMSAVDVATIMRQIGEWMAKFHYNTAMPVVDNCAVLADAMRIKRQGLGWDVEEAALNSGCTEHNISLYESGKLNYTNIGQLNRYLEALGLHLVLVENV